MRCKFCEQAVISAFESGPVLYRSKVVFSMTHLSVTLQGQFINDKQVLLKAADKAGVSGAQELLNDEEELKSEVNSGVVRIPAYIGWKICCRLHADTLLGLPQVSSICGSAWSWL